MAQTLALQTPTYRIELRKRLFFDNFGDGVADQGDWTENSGTWTLAVETELDALSGYVYKQTNTSGNHASYTDHPLTKTNYTIESNVQIKTASGGAAIIGRRVSSTYYQFKVSEGSSNNCRLEKEDGTLIGSAGSFTIALDTWYAIRMIFSGTSITCSVSTDGVSFTDVVTTTDSTYSSGACGVKSFSSLVWFDSISQYEIKKTITKNSNVDFVGANFTERDGVTADDGNMIIRNTSGANFSLLDVGNEIHIWLGYEENTPSLVKRFVGTIEQLTPSLDGQAGDQIDILFHDYEVDLLSKIITKVYVNRDVAYIFRDLINTNADYVTTSTTDAPDTGKVLDRYAFNHKPLKECLDELAIIGDGSVQYSWHINKKLRAVFAEKGITSSGKTLVVGTNILSQSLGKSIIPHRNRIIVYGAGKPDTDNVVEQLTHDQDLSFGKLTTYQKIAQSFTANASEIFDFIIKPTTSGGTPVDAQKVRVTVQEVDGSNLPDGTILKETIITKAEWEEGVTAGTITIPVDAKLDIDRVYAIVLELQDSSQKSDTNFYNIRENSAAGYAGGARLHYNGSSWTSGSPDFYFQLYPRLPNVVTRDDFNSQSSDQKGYGVRVFEDYQKRKEIRTKSAAAERADALMAELSPVPFDGPITTLGLEDVDIGKTIQVTIPNSGISAQDYPVVEMSHSIGKDGFVTSVVLNKKPSLFTDTVGQIEARVKALEAQELDEGGIAAGKGLTETITVTQTPSTELTCGSYYINDSFIWGHPVNGIYYDPANAFIMNEMEVAGDWAQGAGSVTVSISADTTAGHFVVGTQGVKMEWTDVSGEALIRDALPNIDYSGPVGVTSDTPIQGTAGVWVYTTTPSAISDVRLRIISSTGNYHEYTGETYPQKVAGDEGSFSLTNGEIKYVLFDLDVPTATSGSIQWQFISTIQLRVTIAAAGNITFDYLTISKNNTIAHAGLGLRRTTRTANEVTGASE